MCSRDGTGIWMQPGEIQLFAPQYSSAQRVWGIRSAVVHANIKDNIGLSEAHHMLKLLKILWPWKI